MASASLGNIKDFDQSKKMEEYFPITDSNQLIKDQTMTKEIPIAHKIESFSPKQQDVYGSLLVND